MMKFFRWLKKWWWTILIGAGVFLGFLLGFRFRSKDDEGDEPPNFVERAKAKTEAIDAEAAVEKIKIKVEADKKRVHLDEIMKTDDVRERRTRLADFMKDM